MNRSVYAIAAILLAAGAAGADDTTKTEVPKQPGSETAQVAAVTAEPKHDAPAIVVHQNAAPADAHDARVRVGDVRISMSPWSGVTNV